jgi:hypothetical protein
MSGLHAGNNDSILYPEFNKSYLKSYYYDSKAFITSPVKWKLKQWIEFGGITGAAVIAYSQDEKIQKYFVAHQSETAGNFSKYLFEPFGRLSLYHQ